jgi:hypothetical protein
VSLTREIGDVKIAVGVLGSKFGMTTGILGLLEGATLGVAITGLCSSFSWAGSINANVGELKGSLLKVEGRIDRLESSIAARFAKIESSITKLLEQTKSKP